MFIGGEGGKHEKSLRESLFNSSYDREVRPVDDDADAVQLVLDVELFQIVKLVSGNNVRKFTRTFKFPNWLIIPEIRFSIGLTKGLVGSYGIYARAV